jgi:hypothetical protein
MCTVFYFSPKPTQPTPKTSRNVIEFPKKTA